MTPAARSTAAGAGRLVASTSFLRAGDPVDTATVESGVPGCHQDTIITLSLSNKGAECFEHNDFKELNNFFACITHFVTESCYFTEITVNRYMKSWLA